MRYRRWILLPATQCHGDLRGAGLRGRGPAAGWLTRRLGTGVKGVVGRHGAGEEPLGVEPSDLPVELSDEVGDPRHAVAT